MGGPGTGMIGHANSGPAKKDESKVWLGGNAGRRTRAKPELPPVHRFAPPEELTAEQRKVWDRLAPHAFEARTLILSTADSFRDLCEAVVVRDGLLARIMADGYMPEGSKHPLLSDYRGMYQRVEMGMLKFRLAPLGKPMVEPEEPQADPFAEFEGSEQ